MTKVFDCFLFNDELDLLEHRLRTLAGVVSTFVLVEATTTFQGQRKPLHYSDHKARFASWNHQIQHVVVELADADSPWDREHEQHRSFEASLTKASDDDLILVGDCDEIPFSQTVRKLAQSASLPTRLHMKNAVYWGNTVLRHPWTDGTMAFRWRDRNDPSLGILLGRPGAAWGAIPDPASVSEGGWHFGQLGDIAWITNKLASFSHTELLAPTYSAAPHMERCMRLGIDYQSSELLELLDDDAVPVEVGALADHSPYAMRQQPFPSRMIRAVYAAFSASRRRLPARMIAWADKHPSAFLAVFGAPCLIAQFGVRPLWRAAKQARRR